jgi:hypothetical protein
MKYVKIMRSIPRRLNSEMRALIPFTLNSEHHLEKGQDYDIGNEKCEDNVQHAAQAELRDARTDPPQAEQGKIIISEMRDVKICAACGAS